MLLAIFCCLGIFVLSTFYPRNEFPMPNCCRKLANFLRIFPLILFPVFQGLAQTSSSPVLKSIIVIPQVAAIPLGSSQSFKAIGQYSDGTYQTLTDVTWAAQISVDGSSSHPFGSTDCQPDLSDCKDITPPPTSPHSASSYLSIDSTGNATAIALPPFIQQLIQTGNPPELEPSGISAPELLRIQATDAATGMTGVTPGWAPVGINRRQTVLYSASCVNDSTGTTSHGELKLYDVSLASQASQEANPQPPNQIGTSIQLGSYSIACDSTLPMPTTLSGDGKYLYVVNSGIHSSAAADFQISVIALNGGIPVLPLQITTLNGNANHLCYPTGVAESNGGVADIDGFLFVVNAGPVAFVPQPSGGATKAASCQASVSIFAENGLPTSTTFTCSSTGTSCPPVTTPVAIAANVQGNSVYILDSQYDSAKQSYDGYGQYVKLSISASSGTPPQAEIAEITASDVHALNQPFTSTSGPSYSRPLGQDCAANPFAIGISTAFVGGDKGGSGTSPIGADNVWVLTGNNSGPPPNSASCPSTPQVELQSSGYCSSSGSCVYPYGPEPIQTQTSLSPFSGHFASGAIATMPSDGQTASSTLVTPIEALTGLPSDEYIYQVAPLGHADNALPTEQLSHFAPDPLQGLNVVSFNPSGSAFFVGGNSQIDQFNVNFDQTSLTYNATQSTLQSLMGGSAGLAITQAPECDTSKVISGNEVTCYGPYWNGGNVQGYVQLWPNGSRQPTSPPTVTCQAAGCTNTSQSLPPGSQGPYLYQATTNEAIGVTTMNAAGQTIAAGQQTNQSVFVPVNVGAATVNIIGPSTYSLPVGASQPLNAFVQNTNANEENVDWWYYTNPSSTLTCPVVAAVPIDAIEILPPPSSIPGMPGLSNSYQAPSTVTQNVTTVCVWAVWHGGSAPPSKPITITLTYANLTPTIPGPFTEIGQTVAVTLSSSGGAPATLGASNPNDPNFSISNSSSGSSSPCMAGKVLSASQPSCMIYVTFKPTSTSPSSCSSSTPQNCSGGFSIAYNDGFEGTQNSLTVDLTVKAPGITAVLPDFAAPEGGSNNGTITVKNTGNATLSITGITTMSPFSVPTNAVAMDNCTSLLPQASCDISVTFAPNSSGNVQGALVIASNASISPTTVVLNGTGTTPTSISVAVSPANAILTTGGSKHFATTVSPSGYSQNVTWSLEGQGCGGSPCGMISSSGVYTAPSLLPQATIIDTVVATAADGKSTGSATVTVNLAQPVSVSLQPTAAMVLLNQTQQFSSTVSGSVSDKTVAWSLSGPSCANSGCGTISSGGLYTAPSTSPNPASFVITATSNADKSKSAQANVTVLHPVVVTLSPTGPVGVEIGAGASNTVPFSANVEYTTTESVLWSVSGSGCNGHACGTISAAGVYTGPASLAAATSDTVTATSTFAPASQATAQVNLYLPPALSNNSVSETVSAGQKASYDLTLTGGSGDPNQTLTVVCEQTYLPTGVTCPSVTIMPGQGAVAFVLTLQTTGTTSTTGSIVPPLNAARVFAAACPFGAVLLIMLPRKSRGKLGRISKILGCVLFALILSGLMGCGTNGSFGTAPPKAFGGTPSGTFTIPITATSGVQTQTIGQITLTVK
jgi:hypothetical protein